MPGCCVKVAGCCCWLSHWLLSFPPPFWCFISRFSDYCLEMERREGTYSCPCCKLMCAEVILVSFIHFFPSPDWLHSAVRNILRVSAVPGEIIEQSVIYLWPRSTSSFVPEWSLWPIGVTLSTACFEPCASWDVRNDCVFIWRVMLICTNELLILSLPTVN